MVQQAFLDINGVRTSVITYGRWVEESEPQSEDLIIIIPGNPGHTTFYKVFMQTLHEKTGHSVWIVGHAGHEIPRKSVVRNPPFKGNEELYGLKSQVQHKIDFIKTYVKSSNARIHLMGHSIGAYMALETLRDEEINSKVVSLDLLFPTIEHMADTPNGRFMVTFVKPIVWLVLFLSLFFTVLPTIVSGFLMWVWMKIASMPKLHFHNFMSLVNPSVLRKVFFLAYEELDQVRARNDAVIRRNHAKIRALYGKTDGWAPVSYCNRFKGDHPDVSATLSEFEHSFVLRESRQVGEFLANYF